MEFGQKLLELRKSRELTQEELAEALYVSRTAVSKWESGRGYPGIDSLKEIANYFSVTIDDLLSGEKLLSLAQTENKRNIRNICDLLFSAVDLFSILLIVLPLFPNTADGYIYSVNLLNYTQTAPFNKTIYLIMFVLLFAVGIVKLILTKTSFVKYGKALSAISMIVNVLAVLILALTRQVYAVIVLFLFLMIKGTLILKLVKNER